MKAASALAFGSFLASFGTAQAQAINAQAQAIDVRVSPFPVTVGDIVIPTGGVSTLLFKGITPPHGFLVALATAGVPYCVISDNGPAVDHQGFFVGSISGSVVSPTFFAVPMFVTPPAYKPVGPVSVLCNSNNVVLTARMW